MEIKTLENISIDWEKLPTEKVSGTTGFVLVNAFELPNVKIRRLRFSENYEADHWCEKGHIIYVLKGELIIAYDNGTHITVPPGNSLILGDNISSHKAKTEIETQILIID